MTTVTSTTTSRPGCSAPSTTPTRPSSGAPALRVTRASEAVEELRGVVDQLPMAAPQIAPPARAGRPDHGRGQRGLACRRGSRAASARRLAGSLVAAVACPLPRWRRCLLALGVTGGLRAQRRRRRDARADASRWSPPSTAPRRASSSTSAARARSCSTTMPQAPDGRVYQVWLKRGDGRRRDRRTRSSPSATTAAPACRSTSRSRRRARARHGRAGRWQRGAVIAAGGRLADRDYAQFPLVVRRTRSVGYRGSIA